MHGDSIIYFACQSGRVKIGFTTNPWQRFTAIKGMNGGHMVMWACCGGRKSEKYFHQRFAQYRIKGEWFRIEGELREFLNQKLASGFVFEQWWQTLRDRRMIGLEL